MKYFARISVVTALIIIGAMDAMAIEEANKYEVIKKDNQFEIRDYATRILAETVVDGNLEDAGKSPTIAGRGDTWKPAQHGSVSVPAQPFDC